MTTPRYVVVVVPHAVLLGNEVANHRAGPDATGISGRRRPLLDSRRQLRALGLTETGGWAGRFAREQARHAERLVPAKPPVDRAARDRECCREVDDSAPFDVSEDGAAPTPDVQVVRLEGGPDQSPELLPTRRRASTWTDRLAVLGRAMTTSHVGDRDTVIPSGSEVNRDASRPEVFGGRRPAEHADPDRLKSSGAIPRREFVPRDPYRANQLWRCMPGWQASELGTTRGGGVRVRAERDFRRAEPGGAGRTPRACPQRKWIEVREILFSCLGGSLDGLYWRAPS